MFLLDSEKRKLTENSTRKWGFKKKINEWCHGNEENEEFNCLIFNFWRESV